MLKSIKETKVDSMSQLNPKEKDSLISEDQQPG